MDDPKERAVLCVGMMNCDIFFSNIPDNIMQTDTTFMRDFKMCVGGDASNVAQNLAKFGFTSMIAGAVGDDVFGHTTLSLLEEGGVDTRFVRRDSEEGSATSLFWYDTRNRNHRTSYWGANQSVVPEMITDEMLDAADCLFIGSFVTLTGFRGDGPARLLKKAKDRGLFTAANISGGRKPDLEMFRLALPLLDFFAINEQEAEDLTGLTDPDAVIDFIRPFAPAEMALTLGPRGLVMTNFRDEPLVLPTFLRGEPVDTIGAGDAFSSGYLASRLLKCDMRQSALVGLTASALCLENVGAATFGVPFARLFEAAQHNAEAFGF